MCNMNKKNTSDRNSIFKALSRVNIHILLAVVLGIIFLIIILIAAYKIINWGHFIDPDDILENSKNEYVDSFDSIIPLTDKDGMPIYSAAGAQSTIVCFGNAPFADDRNAPDNLANMIASMTGATVYNCSIADSSLTSLPPDTSISNPDHYFHFYWLCLLAAGDEEIAQAYLNALEELKDEAPPEAREVYDTIKSIDFSTVDVITVMYDASDYLGGHLIFMDEDPTNMETFTGSLEAGLQCLKETYPHIRIIVLSPTYAYSDRLDDSGKYISSEIQFYSPALSGLYNYILSQCLSCGRNAVTFVDLYSTITGANANQYLTDHLHLNKDGRKKVAERFVYALEYFNNRAR